VTLQSYLLKVPSSYIGGATLFIAWEIRVMVVYSTSMQISAQYLPSGHDHFPSHAFQFSSYYGAIIRHTSHWQLC